jgi:hypothetical protein
MNDRSGHLPQAMMIRSATPQGCRWHRCAALALTGVGPGIKRLGRANGEVPGSAAPFARMLQHHTCRSQNPQKDSRLLSKHYTLYYTPHTNDKNMSNKTNR